MTRISTEMEQKTRLRLCAVKLIEQDSSAHPSLHVPSTRISHVIACRSANSLFARRPRQGRRGPHEWYPRSNLFLPTPSVPMGSPATLPSNAQGGEGGGREVCAPRVVDAVVTQVVELAVTTQFAVTLLPGYLLCCHLLPFNNTL